MGDEEKGVDLPVAALRRRLVAGAADFLVVTAIGLVLEAALGVVLVQGIGIPAPAGLFPVAMFVGGWVYVVVLETRFDGRTVGKLGTGLRVVRVHAPLDPLWSSVRYVAKVLQLVFGRGLLFGVVVFDERRRALHDHLVGTVVVEDPQWPSIRR